MRNHVKLFFASSLLFAFPAFADKNKHHHNPAPPNTVEQFYMDTFGVSAKTARDRNNIMDSASEIAEMLEIRNDSFSGMAIQHEPFKIKFMVKKCSSNKHSHKSNHHGHKNKDCKKKCH